MRRQLPLIGFRIWNLSEVDCSLRDWVRNHEVWVPAQPMRSASHPTLDNHYGVQGFYGVYHGTTAPKLHDSAGLWHEIGHIYSRKFQRKGQHWVAGASLHWGRVCLHEFGLRSEYAQPIALLYAPETEERWRVRWPDLGADEVPDALLEVGQRYGLRIAQSPAELTALATEWGRLVMPDEVVAL